MNNFSTNDLYTDPIEAVQILRQRQKDYKLQEKVTKFVDIPSPLLKSGVNAVIARNVFTPDYELDIFLKKTRDILANNVLLEYTDDKFIAENGDKHSLGKLTFYLNTSKKDGHVNTSNIKVIDFDKWEGKSILEVKTLWGESLVDFHHRILDHFLPDIINDIFDISKWFHKNGPKAEEYYKKFFALFICNGILFDNFRNHDVESKFLQDVVLPSFKFINDYFGVKPIICPIQNIEDENNPKWWGFPQKRKDEILEMTRSYQTLQSKTAENT